MQRTMLDQWLVPLQQALSQDVFNAAWETGRGMSLDQALELALAAIQEGNGRQLPDRSLAGNKKSLTPDGTVLDCPVEARPTLALVTSHPIRGRTRSLRTSERWSGGFP